MCLGLSQWIGATTVRKAGHLAFNPEGVAWLYQDDGCKQQRQMHFSTHAFSRQEVEFLAAWFQRNGVEAAPKQVKKDEKRYILPPEPCRRRNTAKKREAILEFIEHWNREHGWGGRAAARDEFGVSVNTLKSWKRARPTGAQSRPDCVREVISRTLSLRSIRLNAHHPVEARFRLRRWICQDHPVILHNQLGMLDLGPASCNKGLAFP